MKGPLKVRLKSSFWQKLGSSESKVEVDAKPEELQVLGTESNSNLDSGRAKDAPGTVSHWRSRVLLPSPITLTMSENRNRKRLYKGRRELLQKTKLLPSWS